MASDGPRRYSAKGRSAANQELNQRPDADDTLNLKRLTRPDIIIPIGLAVLSIAAGAAVAWRVSADNATTTKERFETLVARVTSQIDDRMQIYEYGLRGARGAVIAAGVDGITRERFRQYSETRNPDEEFVGSRGFGFIRRVAPAAEAAFLEDARKDGKPDFAIRQLAPHAEERFVIQYIEPQGPNTAAIGLDVASEGHRKEAAITAMDSGEATLTAPLTLVQATGMHSRGFLLFLPVVRPGSAASAVPLRRQSTVGWTYMPLIIDEVLAGFDLQGGEFDFSITDDDVDGPVRFFATADEPQRTEGLLLRQTTLPVYGRGWSIRIWARPPFLQQLNLPSPMAVASVPLAAGLLMAGLAYIHLAGVRRRLQASVEKARLAAIVESSNDAIIGLGLDGRITDWNGGAERLFGYGPNEAIGRIAPNLITPARLVADDQLMIARVARGEAVSKFRSIRQTRDGREIDVLVSASAIRAADGTIVGAAKTLHDISAQMAAERAISELNAGLERQVVERTAQLQAASALQAAILDHAGYAVIATDPSGTITLFNPAAEALLGYEAEELIGKSTPALFHDRQEVIDRAAIVSREVGYDVAPGFDVFVAKAKAGLPSLDQWTYVTRSGERVPVSLNVSLLTSDDGRPLGFLGIARDLSEQLRDDAALKAAKMEADRQSQMLIATMANMDDGLMVVGDDTRIEIFNERALELLGLPEDLMRSRPTAQAILEYQTAQGEFAQSDAQVKSLLMPTLIDGVRSHYERTRPNGTVLEIRTKSFGASSAVRTYRDITVQKRLELELRDNESRFRLLAENTSDVIVLLRNHDDERIYVSPSIKQLLGYSPEEFVALDRTDFVHEEDVAKLAQLRRDLNEENPTATSVHRLRHRLGKWIWVETVYTLLKADEHKSADVIAVIRDVGERHRQQEELQTAKDAAENAANAKSEFLAVMSHELRTPLNSVIGFSRLMLDSGELTTPAMQRYSRLVHDASKTLLSVVNDVLEVSRIEAGAIDLDLRPFSPLALVEGAADLLRPQASDKGVALLVGVAPDLPSSLIGDDARLRQILLNLLSNALKFTAHGKVELEVRSLRSDGDRNHLRFSVRDTGIGIPESKRSRIFERFSQADASTSRTYGGTGLGLSICKSLVELMDGEIGFDSREGHGSEFWFTVDLAPASTAADPGFLDGSAAGPRRNRPLHILLAEDVEMNQELAVAIISEWGHRIDVVSDGAGAVDAVQRQRYDLVLMDVRMPVMDGIEATSRIRAMGGVHARMPIVAMTANVMAEEVARFREAGMNDHIGKPFDPDELHALIDRFAVPDAGDPAVSDDADGDGEEPAVAIREPVLQESALETLATIVGREKTARLLQTFALEARRRLAVLDATQASTDDLASQTHSLISLAGQLGFLELSQLCLEVEEAALAGGGLDRLGALRAATDRAIEAARTTAFAKVA